MGIQMSQETTIHYEFEYKTNRNKGFYQFLIYRVTAYQMGETDRSLIWCTTKTRSEMFGMSPEEIGDSLVKSSTAIAMDLLSQLKDQIHSYKKVLHGKCT
jgi:hypothetical protein